MASGGLPWVVCTGGLSTSVCNASSYVSKIYPCVSENFDTFWQFLITINVLAGFESPSKNCGFSSKQKFFDHIQSIFVELLSGSRQ